MNTIKYLVQLSFVCFVCIGFAQRSAIYSHETVRYNSALSLYNTQQFQSAQLIFKSVESSTSDFFLKSNATYYIANCAVRLNQPNAEFLVESFVRDYPSSIKRNLAYFEIANYYFKTSKYAYACNWYEKVEINRLSISNWEPFHFNYGYSLYKIKNYEKAKLNLNRLESSQLYGSQAKYYMGFMAYQSDDYNTASIYFDQLEGVSSYNENLAYYQADLNFKLGNFKKATDLALVRIKEGSAKEVSELSKIIGESYFNLQDYAKAIPYLEAYKGNKGRWNHSDFYQLGYAFYKQNDYQNSINEFNKIIDVSNDFSQNAYYILAECYLNLNKKQAALNAFKNASEMGFVDTIKEDAWLNYAKLSYEIGNPYQSTTEILSRFLTLYPKSAYKIEVESLLIDSYISSNNYKEALELLKNKPKSIYKEAYQKVTFLRALELYNEADYTASDALLDNSLSISLDPIVKARATYWSAEVAYQLKNYNKALERFKDFSQLVQSYQFKESENLNYNLAYTYFKLKKYGNAIKNFQLYIENKPSDLVVLNDAYLRMADSYFVSTKYSLAIDAYQAALDLNKIEADYATFQIAVSNGYLGQIETKINGLNKVMDYNSSYLKDQALFELANTYANQSNSAKAIEIYTDLITTYSTSPLVSKALLRKGLIEYNQNDTQSALKSFNSVATGYPSSPEAFQAISSSRSIYIDLGQVDTYALWVKSLDYASVSDSELETATYEAAEKQYLDNNVKKAVELFNGYIVGFPNGKQLIKAHFYLAELYNMSALTVNALPHYQYVCEQPVSEFTEKALFKRSKILLYSEDFKVVLNVLLRLESESKNPQNRLYAQSNLMKLYFQFKDYDAAIRYAETILQNSKTDVYIKSDAYIITARAAMKTNNQIKARAAYSQVQEIATGAMGAEAQYYEAYFINSDGDFEASNESVQVLIKNFSSYKYYASKGLIIMAKNFYALNDDFQATYILENVTQNFTDFKEVVDEAQLELERIKLEVSKTNSSVETELQNEN